MRIYNRAVQVGRGLSSLFYARSCTLASNPRAEGTTCVSINQAAHVGSQQQLVPNQYIGQGAFDSSYPHASVLDRVTRSDMLV